MTDYRRIVRMASTVGCFAVVLSLLAPRATWAVQTTFYVDNSSGSCSDSGPGTEANPYCTISAAAAAHKGPGITIFVKPGVYREMVTVPASGASGSPYLFKALGGPVVVDGSDDFSSTSKWAKSSGVYRASSVTWSPQQVFVDGARLAPSTAAPASLPINSFTWVSGQGLYVNLGGANPGTRQTLVGNRQNAFYMSGRAWVTIDGFTTTRFEDRAIRLGNACNNCVIRNNTATFNRKYGIYVPGCDAILVEKNLVSDNQDHGISITSSSTAGSTNCTIQDNESCRNVNPTVRAAVGILIFGSPGNLIQRNRLHDNQDSGLQIDKGSDNCVSIQNRSWNNGDHGYDQLGCTGVSHVGDVAYGNFKDGFSIEGNAPNARVFDCIAVNNGLTTNEFDLWVNDQSSVGFVSDYNIFWNSTSRNPIKFITTQYSTIAAFTAATGQDAHSIQADPKFVNPASADFRPQVGSPAIDDANSGVANWPAIDAAGQLRVDDPATPNTGVGPVPYADRGALEFVTDALPVVAFSVTPSAGRPPLAVTADASGSYDTDGTIVSYLFDFGDGTQIGPQPQPTATHTYGVGNWTASVTATDDVGGTRTASVAVTVVDNLPPNGSIDSPSAISNTTIYAGQAVNFTGTGIDPDENLPLTYVWNFGGGAANSTLEDPGPVIFNVPGTYTVTFTVTDAIGKPDPTPDSRVVTVQPAPAGQAPDEVHWTFTGETSVTFDWRGFDNTLRYGPTTSYGQTATGVTPSPIPFSSAGPFWEAKLTGLQANSTYHYSLGNGTDHTFHTLPPRGTSDFMIFVEADIGSALKNFRVAAVESLIAAQPPAFVLAPGDLSYANDYGLATVDGHFNDVMRWSQDAAYMAAWGNHEWEGPTDDLRNYKGRFDFPNPQTSPDAPAISCCGEDWYWFDYGNVRFIGYPEPWTTSQNTLADWNPKATALMDQAQSDPAIRFIVTFGHRPAYSSGHHPGEPVLQGYLDALGTTHSKYVLNLNGHSHNYERTYPQHGVVHITTGTGGSDLEEDGSGSCLWLTGCPPPAWSAFRAFHHGALRLRFTASHVYADFICGPAGDSGKNINDVSCTPGSILDSIIIPDQSPVVTTPATAGVAENSPLAVSVTATDPDGDPISSLAASGLPPGATFTPGPGNTTGSLTWTPNYSQAGSYTVTFTASNWLSGSAATVITVANTDRAPVVTAPAGAAVLVGNQLTVAVSASDPDGEAIGSLTADLTGLPAGATFTAGPDNATGTFSWTPREGEAGRYSVTFTGANALSGSASTTISVTESAHAPVVSAPDSVTVAENSLLTLKATAADPDTEAITSFTASGLPAGATFTAGPGDTTGTLSWTPSYEQAGSYTVTFTASNALTGSASTVITVTNVDRAPLVTAPATANGKALSQITVNVTASDPDGEAIASLAASGQPAGATFTPGTGNTTGTLTWTPATGDTGTYNVYFTATNALSGSAATAITVRPANQPPTAALAVTPSTGNAPLAVSASAAGSSDPDGTIASYRFDFGDGTIVGPQAAPTATHSYGAGNWTAILTVTDNDGASRSASVPIVVAAVPPQPNLVGNPSFEVNLNGWTFQASATMSRVAGGFDGGFAAQFTGTGTTTASFGLNDKPDWVGNVTAAGIKYRFSAWVRSASNTGSAKILVTEYLIATGAKLGTVTSVGVPLSPTWKLVTVDYVTVAGASPSTLDFWVKDYPLVLGETFLVDNVSIRDVTGGGAAATLIDSSPTGSRTRTPMRFTNQSAPVDLVPLRPTLSPSPLRSQGTLRFATSRPGMLRVELIDLAGRRVRQLLDDTDAPAGEHQLQVDGRGDNGVPLSQGIYFYRIQAQEGLATGRFLIIR